MLIKVPAFFIPTPFDVGQCSTKVITIAMIKVIAIVIHNIDMAVKSNRNNRADHQKNKRREYDKQRKRLLRAGKANGAECAICGLPIDFSLKHPHPMSVSVDHIIPLAKGGSVSDPDNLQLTHFKCNVKKSDNLMTLDTMQTSVHSNEKIGNRVLPQSCDWQNF